MNGHPDEMAFDFDPASYLRSVVDPDTIAASEFDAVVRFATDVNPPGHEPDAALLLALILVKSNICVRGNYGVERVRDVDVRPRRWHRPPDSRDVRRVMSLDADRQHRGTLPRTWSGRAPGALSLDKLQVAAPFPPGARCVSRSSRTPKPRTVRYSGR